MRDLYLSLHRVQRLQSLLLVSWSRRGRPGRSTRPASRSMRSRRRPGCPLGRLCRLIKPLNIENITSVRTLARMLAHRELELRANFGATTLIHLLQHAFPSTNMVPGRGSLHEEVDRYPHRCCVCGLKGILTCRIIMATRIYSIYNMCLAPSDYVLYACFFVSSPCMWPCLPA